MKRTILMLALAGAIAQAPRARSQEPVAPQPNAKAEERITASIRLKHISPQLLARIIGPREAKPVGVGGIYTKEDIGSILKGEEEDERGVRVLRLPAGASFDLGPPAGGSKLSLPKGIDDLVPGAAEDEIQARGTPKGIAELRLVIARLDVPPRRVEVEIHMVRLSRADLRPLLSNAHPGMTPLDKALGQAQQIGSAFVAGPGFRARLDALLDAKRAQDLLLQRAIAINTTRTQATLDRSAFDGTDDLEIQATPTANNDNTITLSLRARLGKQEKFATINVSDSESFAFFLPPRPGQGQFTAVFITPLILSAVSPPK